MPLPYPEALPVCVPLGEQVPQPPDLAKDWAELSLEQRTTYLTDNSPLLRVATYTSAGLELGAQRADQAANPGSDTMQNMLQAQLDTPEVHTRFLLGLEEQPTRRFPSYKRLCDPIEDFFGPDLNNPHFVRSWGLSLNELSAPLNAADDTDWPLPLRAIMNAQFLYQVAAKRTRATITPLIKEAPPKIQEGMEGQFWKSRLVGAGTMLGIAYCLGYRAKSGPIIKEAMHTEWGDDYTFNREVFLAAINMDSSNLPKGSERNKLQNEVRRPVFSLIAQGHFNLACSALRKAASEKPEAFSLLSQRFLRRQQQD